MGNNLERIAQAWTPPTVEEIERCVVKSHTVSKLDPEKLSVEFLLDGARSGLIIDTVGDASLFLRYWKRNALREGFDLSVQDSSPDEIEILQLKGGKPAGLRIDQGLNVAKFMAEQTLRIAEHPDSSIRFITMGDPIQLLHNKTSIPTYNDYGKTRDVARYEAFANYLGMKWSEEEKRYVREIFREPQTPVVLFQV